MCLVRWFVSGLGGSLGQTVGVPVSSQLFDWLDSSLFDGELVGVFVDKLVGEWVGSLVVWSVVQLMG